MGRDRGFGGRLRSNWAGHSGASPAARTALRLHLAATSGNFGGPFSRCGVSHRRSLRKKMNVRLERKDQRLDNLEQNQAVKLERTASPALARPGNEPLPVLASGTAASHPAVDAL